MSENGVTRLLLIILVISSAQIGTPLECYVCTSVENSACTSSLSGIERSTCSLDETTEPTLVSTIATTTSDSGITGSTVTVGPTSSATDVTSETTSSSDSGSTSETTADSTSSTTEDSNSETTSVETSTSISTSTEGVSESATPTETTTPKNTSDADNGSENLEDLENGEDSEDSDDGKDDEDVEADVPEVVRVVRDADVAFSCYTLSLIKDNVTVTERGCAVRSSSICETLNEEKYPGYNFTTCNTCTEDGCNSSPINLSGIPSLFLPLIMFFLTR